MQSPLNFYEYLRQGLDNICFENICMMPTCSLMEVNGFIFCVIKKSVICAVIIGLKDGCPLEKGKYVASFLEIKPTRDNKKGDNPFY